MCVLLESKILSHNHQMNWTVWF